MTARISEQTIGELENGQAIKRYCLRNSRGTEAVFLNLGAAWVGFQRPEDSQSLVLGCDTVEAFQTQKAYLGATAGRFANRIAKGRFVLNGEQIQLDINDGENHLHGGHSGFSYQLFESHIQLNEGSVPELTFRYHSPANEAGYPGNIELTVLIRLTEDDRVQFNYSATTDAPTILNPTCHAYFNLDGHLAGTLKNHEFKLDAENFVESDDALIPTGKCPAVAGTVMDLRSWHNIQSEINDLSDPNLQQAGGYDHCYCYPQDKAFRLLASARSASSKILLECRSDLPGVQFYSGNFLAGTPLNKNDSYQKQGAFCLEPGVWPDSPNHPLFPDCTIDEDNAYSAIIEYSFQSVDL
ncbi:MAG: galactose mutarotase [Reinekea sp.]